MKSKEKRQSYRHPILTEEIEIVQLGLLSKFIMDYKKLQNISQGGCQISDNSIEKYKIGEKLLISFELPGDLGKVTIDGIIKWIDWKKKDKEQHGIGIKFVNVSERIQSILNAYIIYLRNKQIISVSKRIMEEYFTK